MPLSDLKIRKLKPEIKPKKYFDRGGLYLQVNPSGTKCWRIKYRYFDTPKIMAIGTYPEMSLEMARDKLFETKRILRENKDPCTQKKETKRLAKFNSNNTFEAVAKEWHDLNKHKWTPEHASRVWNRMENHVIPVIGKRPISEIHALELLEDIVRKIEKKDKTETSHRVLQTCGAIFRFGILTKRLSYNPAQDLRGALKPHKKQSYPTIQIDEVPEFLKRLEDYKTSELNKLAIKMLMLVFVRQGELRQAQWKHMSFEKKIWCIPAHLMKMREEHIVPLSKQTLDIIEKIKIISGSSEYLFPTQNKIRHPIMSENLINDIIKEIGYKGRLVAHGFRSLASTTLNELGYAPDVIERQLAHSERNEVRAAYNRAEYLPQRICMMQEWADYIDGLKMAKLEAA